MQCPQCGSEMQAGYTVVKADIGILRTLFGYGSNGEQHLYFVPAGPLAGQDLRLAGYTRGGEVVQKALQAVEAHRCGGCKTVAIPGRDPTKRPPTVN